MRDLLFIGGIAQFTHSHKPNQDYFEYNIKFNIVDSSKKRRSQNLKNNFSNEKMYKSSRWKKWFFFN